MSLFPIGVAVVSASHQMSWVDEGFAGLIGYSKAELIGKTFEDITHPQDVKLDSTLATRLFSGELVHYEMEKRYLHKDGSVVPIHLNVSLLRDRRQNVLYGLAVVERVSIANACSVATSAPMTKEEAEMDRIRRAIMD